MKLTRHNGRSGKHGTYNPRHNDRRFDVENSEHIDAERARQNVYWDCYRGFTTHDFRENPEQPDFSFEEIERMYYYEHYADHVNAQNARNEKTRHIERNRTVDDLLKNNKTCPEESIYQIGTMEESVPPETLALIVSEFYEEFENRFGSHIHILDWALHLDEGTPHIHERHVFDCENRYGELCPQQEKALEELGIPLPKPEQAKGKHNNRKQTFDAVCRTILFDIAKRHGLHLEQEPSYGGREYLEKQDYHCRHSEADVESRCHKMRLNAAELEQAVFLTLKKQMEAAAPLAPDGTLRVEASVPERAEYEQQIETLQDGKRTLYERYLMGEIDLNTYKAEKAACDELLLKTKNAYAAVLAQAKQKQDEQARQDSRKEASKVIFDADTLTTELAELLIDRVLVYPDKRIEVAYKIQDIFD